LPSSVVNNPGTKCPVTLRGSNSYGTKPENVDRGGQEEESQGQGRERAVQPQAGERCISGAMDGISSEMFIGNEHDLNNVLADKHQPDEGEGKARSGRIKDPEAPSVK
jgi:hypothetical protein